MGGGIGRNGQDNIKLMPRPSVLVPAHSFCRTNLWLFSAVDTGENPARTERSLRASVPPAFPPGRTANPTLTLSALALRTAESIADDLKSPG